MNEFHESPFASFGAPLDPYETDIQGWGNFGPDGHESHDNALPRNIATSATTIAGPPLVPSGPSYPSLSSSRVLSGSYPVLSTELRARIARNRATALQRRASKRIANGVTTTVYTGDTGANCPGFADTVLPMPPHVQATSSRRNRFAFGNVPEHTARQATAQAAAA